MNTTSLQIEIIDRNPGQPRRRFDPEALDELAASIKSLGLLEPIIVMPFDGRYTIVAGERRWRACQMAGLTEIPCIVRDDLDYRSAFEIAMVENVIRADMSPVEEARGYQTLVAAGLSPAEIAERLGKSLTAVHYRMALLKLAAPILDLVDVGQLNERDGWLMARLSHESQFRVVRAMNAGLIKRPGDLAHLVNAIALEENQVAMFADNEAPVIPADTLKATKTLADRLEAAMRALDEATAAIAQATIDETAEAVARELKRRAAKVADSMAARRMATSVQQLSVA